MTTTNPRCVVDTNVLISAFISAEGNPSKTVRYVLTNGVFLASTATFEEFDTRIRRPWIRKYGHPDELEAYIETVV
jgi:predicted nucleic acid-binding protein